MTTRTMRQRERWSPRAVGAVVAALVLAAPAVAAAAGGGGHDFRWSVEGLFILDFVILFGGLFFLARKPVANLVRRRREALTERVREAHGERDEALAKRNDYRQRMARIDDEVREIVENAKSDAQRLKQNILDESQSQLARMADDARARARDEVERLRGRLRAELVEAALSEAEVGLRAQLDDQARAQLVSQYVTWVEDLARGGTAGSPMTTDA